jgi:hypothetical protein
MTTVREIVTPKAEVQETIVRHLEDLLERARAGEFESFLWFADSAHSARMLWGTSGAATNMDEVRLVGRLEVLRHTFLTRFTEGTRDT